MFFYDGELSGHTGGTMKFLSLFKGKNKNTQVMSRSETSLEIEADNILSKRGKQIEDGLSKTTASTGTPMENLHGGAKKMAQMSNIGGGSKATGGGGVDEGMRAMLQYTQADAVKKTVANSKNIRSYGEIDKVESKDNK